MNDNCQSTPNIKSKIDMIDSRSEIIGMRPLEKISLIDSISLIVLVVRVPIGVVSNWRRLRFYTFL